MLIQASLLFLRRSRDLGSQSKFPAQPSLPEPGSRDSADCGSLFYFTCVCFDSEDLYDCSKQSLLLVDSKVSEHHLKPRSGSELAYWECSR